MNTNIFTLHLNRLSKNTYRSKKELLQTSFLVGIYTFKSNSDENISQNRA